MTPFWPRTVVLLILGLALHNASPVHAQQAPRDDGVLGMGNWLQFRQTTFRGKPILLHLRAGYERAVLMPEPVRLENANLEIPGCAIEIDGDIVGFYPQYGFERRTVAFVGLDTGRRFILRVSASETGIRQPLEILDP